MKTGICTSGGIKPVHVLMPLRSRSSCIAHFWYFAAFGSMLREYFSRIAANCGRKLTVFRPINNC